VNPITMTRISRVSTREDFEAETWREALRDRRSRRLRRNLWCAAVVFVLVASCVGGSGLGFVIRLP
jgi:hypothetical protein